MAADPLERLDRAFFERDPVEVARDLVGRWLRRDEVVLRITEVEAYRGPHDTACHTSKGRTPRTAPMWGPPGRAYVYLCYGLHQMLNLVAGPEGTGAAILIRSGEPVAGLETIRLRRGGKEGPVLLTGPGKVAAALGIDTSWSHHDLTEPGGLEILHGEPVERLLVGPRIGIDYAAQADREALWRFAARDTPWVSVPRGLRPAER